MSPQLFSVVLFTSLCLGVSAAPLASASSGPASFVIHSVGSTVSISSVANCKGKCCYSAYIAHALK